MSKGKIGVFTPISEVFPEIKNDFETFQSLVKELNRTETIFWCAYLNNVVSGFHKLKHKERQDEILPRFFTQEEINKINKFVVNQGSIENVTVFFRGQLLELMRWVILLSMDKKNDENPMENPDVQNRFAKAALLASEIWSQRVFGNKLSDINDISTGREKVLGPFRKSSEASIKSPDLYQSLGRGFKLFNEFVPKFYEGFEEEFKAKTKLSIKEYYVCLGSLLAQFRSVDVNKFVFNINTFTENTACNNVFQNFYEIESQLLDDLRNALRVNEFENGLRPYDYRPLREKPIIRANDGRAVISDPIFFNDKAAVGPLFHLIRGIKNERKVQEIFGKFGDAFENYSCEILNRMYPSESSVLVPRLSCDVKDKDPDGMEIQIDACLNDVKDLVLFEMKATWIRESEILSNNHENFAEHLSEKYRHGLNQHARFIELIGNKRWLGPKNEFDQVKVIYPVLLVHDYLLDAPLFSAFLANQFWKVLFPSSDFKIGNFKIGDLIVSHLIVLTIEDLENLETSVEEFAFRDFLNEYSLSSPDRFNSIKYFMANSKYVSKIRPNKTLIAETCNFLEKTIKEIFPNNIDS